MSTAKAVQKKATPSPGRKLAVKESIERVNKKHGKALAKLAK